MKIEDQLSASMRDRGVRTIERREDTMNLIVYDKLGLIQLFQKK